MERDMVYISVSDGKNLRIQALDAEGKVTEATIEGYRVLDMHWDTDVIMSDDAPIQTLVQSMEITIKIPNPMARKMYEWAQENSLLEDVEDDLTGDEV